MCAFDLDDLSPAGYKAAWASLGQIQITMVEKCGECPHNEGDTFTYENPYKRPEGVCTALLNVLDNYTWRTVLGFPSWNEKDRRVYRIHCPDAAGTIWEMKRIEQEKTSHE